MRTLLVLVSLLLAVIFSGCSEGSLKQVLTFKKPDPTTFSVNKKKIYKYYPPFKLSGGLPAGGVYAGPGVKDGRFYPEKAGTGTHKISYTVNDQAAFDVIEVTGPKKRTIDPNCTTCKGTGKQGCEKHISCTSCKGRGRFWARDCLKCDCKGKIRAWYKAWCGYRTCPDCNGDGVFYRRCEDCKGTGKEKCPVCKGTGHKKCTKCN